MYGPIDMNRNKLINLNTPEHPSESSNKAYVDKKIDGLISLNNDIVKLISELENKLKTKIHNDLKTTLNSYIQTKIEELTLKINTKIAKLSSECETKVNDLDNGLKIYINSKDQENINVIKALIYNHVQPEITNKLITKITELEHKLITKK